MPSAAAPLIVHVLTYNNEKTIAACLRSLLAQKGFVLGESLHVHVSDNASNDDTRSLLRSFPSTEITVFENEENTGFCRGHNLGIARALELGSSYIAVINPDLHLEPNALRLMVDALEQDPRAGSACPKLLRADENLHPVQPRRLDSSGMHMTPAIRHFDRGSEEFDIGQYENEEYVFGASGACMLLRREFVLDAAFSVPGDTTEIELFDESFFAYREDADLAWRGLQLGWKCRYCPSAVGFHTRVVLPERRDSLPPQLNAWSVRNRFLLQFNNFRPLSLLHCIPKTLYRNLIVLGAVCTIERSSFSGVLGALKALPSALIKRSAISQKTRVPGWRVAQWFKTDPYSESALSHEAEPAVRSVSAVIVNYNSGTRLSRCLESLLLLEDSTESPSLELLVVDNASTDDSLERVRSKLEASDRIRLLAPGKNLGFAGAINLAAEESRADALLILNPDAFVTETAIRELAAAFSLDSRLAALSPVLTNEDGSPQLGFVARGFPTLSSILAELFFLHRLWPNNPWTAAYHLRGDRFVDQYLRNTQRGSELPHEAPGRPLLVSQPAGACLMVLRSAFDDLGGFDASFWPAWFEDVDFCRRLHNRGWLCGVLDSAKVVHEGGYSLESLKDGRFFEIWYGNLLRYWKLHGSSLQYAALRSLLPFALLLRAARCFGASVWTSDSGAAQNARSLASLAFRTPLK